MDSNPVDSYRQVETQAARILEQIQALDSQYGPTISEKQPELATALNDCAGLLVQLIHGAAQR